MSRATALLFSLAALHAPALATARKQGTPPPMRVGLDTQGTEWLVGLEGGGEVRSRSGRALMKVREGEKLRLWWDSRGEADPTDEFRIQVGRASSAKDADALMAKLKAAGEAPEKKFVADGGTWRVLTGHFETVEAADPILQKLQAAGYDELWVASEARPGKARKGRALYAITDRYERRPLPAEGVSLWARNEVISLGGKGRYRGKLEVFPNALGRLTVVNELDMETYVRGVVPREMGANEFPALEALKAQAVAARTYAMANKGKRASEGFDLLDTVADQVYGGAGGEQPLTDQATRETAGLVATFEGRPIQALFTANSGGATVDNTHVFGGPQPYLKGVSNYAAKPLTLPFKGLVDPGPDQGWLNAELLRMGGFGIIQTSWLNAGAMTAPLKGSDLLGPLSRLASRFWLTPPQASLDQGPKLYLWMARSFGFDQVVEGLEQPQDAAYFLGDAAVEPKDRLLAAFLTRRGIVPASLWKQAAPTLGQGLSVLARLWAEVEPPEILEGTLLMDGTVRRKNATPEPLLLAPQILLAEEAPGGTLRLLGDAAIQVGDRVRWMPQSAEGSSKVLIRRLDPDGAALDRYNPTAHWKELVKDADLVARLQKRVALQGIRELRLQHNANGRVLDLQVIDSGGRAHAFTGMRIRLALGLKDNPFRVLTVGSGVKKTWIFYGRGWGHGVGMDQTGAYGLALEGWSFDAILKRYYRGIELTKSY
ncbi:MAG: SpoIID/LytB domain-containing protein [Holophagaceae bacterium]|nr:SpoIID/LytB domain-containing protein [Holophagaceae bacterium]